MLTRTRKKRKSQISNIQWAINSIRICRERLLDKVMNQTSILQWQLPLIKTQWGQSNLRPSRTMVGNSSRLRWLQNKSYKRRRMLQSGREKKNWRWQLMEQNRTMLKPNLQRLTMRSILWLQPTKSIQINHRCPTRNRSSCRPSRKSQQT